MEFNDKIKNHMRTNIVYTTEEDRLADVVFKMSQAETDMAIVKSKNDIVGVITETDIYFALVKDVLPEPSKKPKTPENINNMKVIDIMRGPPAKKVMSSCESTGCYPCIEAYEDDTIEDAIRIMEKSDRHHLLVRNKKNKLVGTISSSDIIKSFGRSKAKKK
jgi:CBS domain-containing protein